MARSGTTPDDKTALEALALSRQLDSVIDDLSNTEQVTREVRRAKDGLLNLQDGEGLPGRIESAKKALARGQALVKLVTVGGK